MTTTTIVNRYPELFAPRLRIPYDELDELMHTSDAPFCSDTTCPCHEDYLLWEELVGAPVRTGLMTHAEGKRLFAGSQL